MEINSQNYSSAELHDAEFTDISEQCTAYIFTEEDGLLVVVSPPSELAELARRATDGGHRTQIEVCDTTQIQTQTTQTKNLSSTLFLLPRLFCCV